MYAFCASSSRLCNLCRGLQHDTPAAPCFSALRCLNPRRLLSNDSSCMICHVRSVTGIFLAYHHENHQRVHEAFSPSRGKEHAHKSVSDKAWIHFWPVAEWNELATFGIRNTPPTASVTWKINAVGTRARESSDPITQRTQRMHA